MTFRRPLVVLAVALALFATGIAAIQADPSDAPAAASDPPVHDDPLALERAMLEAERQVLRDDVEALATALGAIPGLTRRLEKGAAGRYEPIRGVDRGFHVALDAAIEAAEGGDLQEAAQQTYWVSVGCRKCHVAARKNALLPNTPLLQGD